MKTVIAWDTETALIRPALLAPPLVCVTWQVAGEASAHIEHHTTVELRLRAWLEDPDVLLVGHNVAYDFGVVAERFPALRPLIFAAYDADRVTDTMLRAFLLDIASGTFRRKHVGKGVFVKQQYGLADLAKRYVGLDLVKDAWRLLYGHFIDVPLERWPERARLLQAEGRARLAEIQRVIDADATALDDKALKKEFDGLREMVDGPTDRVTEYPLDDARATLAIYLAQEKHAQWLDDQFRQARAYFWLHLSSCWGLRTDERGVEILRAETEASIAELEEELGELGLIRPDGSRDTKAAKRRMLDICRRDGLTIPRTATHADGTKCSRLDGTELPATKGGHPDCEDHVCLDYDACEATEDDVLIGYAEYSQSRKVLSNDVKALAAGVHWPVHTSYGLAETGRTTSSGRR
jgi:hypothetical protein